MLQRLLVPALLCSVSFLIQACGSSNSKTSGSGGSTALGGTITPSGGTTAAAGGHQQVTSGSQKDAGMSADAADATGVPDAAYDSGQACNQTLSDNWNTSVCTIHTSTTSLSLTVASQVDSLVIWVDTSVAGVALSYTLTGPAGAVSSGNLDQGTCDPYQSQWCALTAHVSRVLSAGSYSIQISAAAMCANSGSSNVGFVRVVGCASMPTGGASGATGATGGNGGASGGAGAGGSTSNGGVSSAGGTAAGGVTSMGGSTTTSSTTGTGGISSVGGTTSGAPANERIYTSNYNGLYDTITFYPANGTGDVVPMGKITGTNTKLAQGNGIVSGNGIVFDGTGKMYVLVNSGSGSSASIEIFAADAAGNVAPIATLAGSSTGLLTPVSLAVDAAGKIYTGGSVPCATCGIGSHAGILVFAAGATGDTAPLQTIAPAVYPDVDNTGLDTSDMNVAVDASGNIYTAPGCDSKILVFAPNANGNVAPARVITGDKTQLGCNEGMAFDGAGNLYVANGVYSGSLAPSVTVYPPGANGNVAPIAMISGDKTGLYGAALRIALDNSGWLYATGAALDASGRSRNAILLFAPGTNGNVAPTAALAGADTEINANDLALY